MIIKKVELIYPISSHNVSSVFYEERYEFKLAKELNLLKISDKTTKKVVYTSLSNVKEMLVEEVEEIKKSK